jgi:uncharacterized membrane protein (DUF2068 family)
MQSQGPAKPVVGLRIIAIYKFCKTLLVLGVAWGLFRLVHADLDSVSDRVLALFHLKAEFRLVRELREQFVGLSPRELRLGGVDALVCAVLFAAEGLGLWWEKKWAEWMVIINSGILVPFEIKAVWVHPDWLRGSILVINLLIIFYIARIVWLNRQADR